MPDRDRTPIRRRQRPLALRLSAALLSAVLVFAALAPSFAWAEGESEGEGAAPPGSIPPGLEEGPGFEPGGEETGLAEVAAGAGEEEAEEAPPEGVESVPAPEESIAPAAVGTEPEAAPEAQLPSEESPPSAPPAYEPDEKTAPSYETSTPAAPVEAVRNEAIVAPTATTKKRDEKRHASAATTAERETSPVETEAPSPDPEQVVSTSAAPTVATEGAGRLRGKSVHTVAPGECLWSIAEGVLPVGASNAEVAAEVTRLWRINTARIGTGDPDLILVGTVLRLHR